jgi:hypothetical protein
MRAQNAQQCTSLNHFHPNPDSTLVRPAKNVMSPNECQALLDLSAKVFSTPFPGSNNRLQPKPDRAKGNCLSGTKDTVA